MSEYDGRIVIDSHIDTTRFDLDASKLFTKAKKLSDKLSIGVKTKGINLGFNIDDIDKLVPKNMDKRIGEITKYASELGKQTLLSDIPSKLNDVTNSARKATVQMGNLKNKIIDTVDAINSGDFSDKDKHTLLLSAERAQRELTRKEVIKPESLLSIQDSNELNKTVDTFKLKLNEAESTVSKFQNVSISKALEADKAKAEVIGVSKEFNLLQNKINSSEVYLQSLVDKLKQLKDSPGNYDINDFINKVKVLTTEINNVSKSIELNSIKQQSLLNQDALANSVESAKKLSQEVSKSNNELDKMGAKASGLGGMFSKSFSGVTGLFDMITSRFRWIALGQVIRAVINDAKQSITDLRTYNKEFDNSMQSLRDSAKKVGNSLATSFAPVLQALAPIVANLAMWLTELFNKFSMFNAALFTGAKTAVIADTSFSGYSKSADKSTKNTKKGTKAVKDQTKALAKFDKLDVFKKDKKKSPDSGISDAVSSIPQAMKMFKTVEIPNTINSFANKVREKAQKVKQAMQPLIDDIKENPQPYAAIAGIGVGSVLLSKGIKKVIGKTSGKLLPKLGSKLLGKFAGNKLVNSLTGRIFGKSAGKLSAELAGKTIGKSVAGPIGFLADMVGTYIYANSYIKEKIPDFHKLISSTTGSNAGAIGFIKDSDKYLKEHGKKGIFDEEYKKRQEEIDKNFNESFGNAITNFFGGGEKRKLEIQKEKGKGGITFEEFKKNSKEAFDNLKTSASDSYNWIKENVFDKTGDWFKQRGEDAKKFGEKLKDGFQFSYNWIKENVFDKIVNWFIQRGEDIKKVGDNLKIGFENSYNWIKENVFDKISRWFSGFGEKFSSFFRGVGNFFSNPMSSITSRFSSFRIPHFASGTVVSPNKKFLAMLGDNTSEQEVVSPVSTMKQAFMEAIAETGMHGGSGDVVLQLDGTTFARLMNPYNRAEQNRIGMSMIEGVAY